MTGFDLGAPVAKRVRERMRGRTVDRMWIRVSGQAECEVREQVRGRVEGLVLLRVFGWVWAHVYRGIRL